MVIRKRARAQAGFTLIELIVVVTIIGILAGVAIVNVRWGQRKAREAALMHNLHQMREAIDNFYADKRRFPSNLEELVPNYLRAIPKDPLTQTAEWEEVMDAPDPDAPPENDADGNPVAPGVTDVKSRAPGMTLDNVPYAEL